MTDTFRDRLRALGAELNPQMIGGSVALYAQHASDWTKRGLPIERDIAYGPHERHRLDIFSDGTTQGQRPVFVYVHGGGFVAGNKTLPDTPFYGNVAAWAVQQGYVGVTLTYRLAPDHPWPAGPEDLAAAVRWLRANIANYGGSPDRIFVAGQSAGAAHVASYLAMTELHDESPAVAGALMFSGIYDITVLDKGQFELQYFGDDASLAQKQSALPGLLESAIPMLFTVAEHDPAMFQKQAAHLVARWFEARRVFAPMIWMPGANHMSAALGLGGPDQFLGPEIVEFIKQHSS